mmetsp:Transcript_6356/g.17703  ORF Transcript_6356/g.17703 Transcript_6356/m.17703 type:complete len:201 (+) Transcript_6356:144-746(+)
MLRVATHMASITREVGNFFCNRLSVTALMPMPIMVQSPMATPPRRLISAPTMRPPMACRRTGIIVVGRQPTSVSCTRTPMTRAAIEGSTPQSANSKLKKALGRSPLNIATWDNAAPRPEHTAVITANTDPDDDLLGLQVDLRSLEPEEGATSRAPAQMANHRAAICRGFCGSPRSTHPATAHHTTLVWLMVLKVTLSHFR